MENSAFYQYMRDVSQYPLLTREQEIQLAERYRRGDLSARQQLINSNLKLVVKVAMQYTSPGISLMDLIQEGNLGLMEAVERYNPSECKFSTYARWWIRKGILGYIETDGTIKLPANLATSTRQIHRITDNHNSVYGREPTLKEIASALRRQTGRAYPIKELEALIGRINKIPIITSLEDLVDGGQSLADDSYTDPAKELFREQFSRALREVLSNAS